MVKRSLFVLLIIMSVMKIFAETTHPMSLIDSVAVRELGEDVAHALLASDSIVAKLTVWEDDSLPDRQLTCWMANLVKYALCQPILYKSDRRIYMGFYADVILRFISSEKELRVELDYNSEKWRIVDDKGEQLLRRDLKNFELLPLMHILWPESKNINIKYNALIYSDEK